MEEELAAEILSAIGFDGAQKTTGGIQDSIRMGLSESQTPFTNAVSIIASIMREYKEVVKEEVKCELKMELKMELRLDIDMKMSEYASAGIPRTALDKKSTSADHLDIPEFVITDDSCIAGIKTGYSSIEDMMPKSDVFISSNGSKIW
jgi:hypothetical protein